MKNALLWLAATLVLSACGGDEGPAGPPGPAGVPGQPNRNDIYCRVANTATLAGSMTLTASCDAATDVPLSGSCSSGTLPAGHHLARNAPDGWDNDGAVPASWVCSWRPEVGAAIVDSIPGTTATICCVPAE